MAEKDHFKFGSQKSDAELLKVLRRDNSNLQHEIDGLIPLLRDARSLVRSVATEWSKRTEHHYANTLLARLDAALDSPPSGGTEHG